MGRLAGYRAIVTGAASGIGAAIVARFLAEGARLVAVVRREADREMLLGRGCAEAVVGDVRDYETSARAVAAAGELFGGLDVFVANAGLWDFHKRVEKQSPEQLGRAFEDIVKVNLLGPLYAAHAGLDALRESRGSIIVTGSNACFRAGGGGAIYTASKFALRGLVMQLAKEFAPAVRVNGVAPGATDTPLSGPAALDQQEREMNADRERLAAMGAAIPMARPARAEEHAALYVALASRDESGYVTGAMFPSDGGLTLSV